MLAAQFGSLIRKERLAKGLKQTELAQAARVSRTVISRLEQERHSPVQTDVLERILGVLNIKPHLTGSSALEARQRARLEQHTKLEQRRNRHLRLAVELASNPKPARQLIAKAKTVVELWQRNRSCSPFYIKRWSALLALPPRELARTMASLGAWEDALFQNTPWAWAWT